MKYYSLDPDVAGEFGPNTVLDHSTRPPTAVRLHVEIDLWDGDELLEVFPCFVVSERVADIARRNRFTGAQIGPVEVTKSENFQALHPDLVLPMFVWLKVNGHPGADDFGLADGIRLVVSERVLGCLQLKHCEASEFTAK
jgi:hypothetical protein